MWSDAVIAPLAEQYADENETIADKMTDLEKNISVYVPGGSQTVCVSVTDEDPLAAQEICNAIVDAGINALNNSTSSATISVVFPSSKALEVADSESSAISSIGKMAAIFLVLALMIILIRELAMAYKAHNAAKEQK